jgi:hypothetical protein
MTFTQDVDVNPYVVDFFHKIASQKGQLKSLRFENQQLKGQVERLEGEVVELREKIDLLKTQHKKDLEHIS